MWLSEHLKFESTSWSRGSKFLFFLKEGAVNSSSRESQQHANSSRGARTMAEASPRAPSSRQSGRPPPSRFTWPEPDPLLPPGAVVPPHLRRPPRLHPQVRRAPPLATTARLPLQPLRRLLRPLRPHIFLPPAQCRPPPQLACRPLGPRPRPPPPLVLPRRPWEGRRSRRLGSHYRRATRTIQETDALRTLQVELERGCALCCRRRLQPWRLPPWPFRRRLRGDYQQGNVLLCLLIRGWWVERACLWSASLRLLFWSFERRWSRGEFALLHVWHDEPPGNPRVWSADTRDVCDSCTS